MPTLAEILTFEEKLTFAEPLTFEDALEMKNNSDRQETSPEDEVLEPYGSSVVQFCRFVEAYIRQTTDPMTTAAICEDQAEAVRISRQDIRPETIDLLMETLLNVITELERKWRDEHRLRLQRRTFFSYFVPWKWFSFWKRLEPGIGITLLGGAMALGWLLWFLFDYSL